MNIGPDPRSIQQFRRDAQYMVDSSTRAERDIGSVEDGARRGSDDATSAGYYANQASRDTAETDSSYTGQSLQSALSSLSYGQTNVSNAVTGATRSISDTKGQIGSLLSALGSYTASLSPGPTQVALTDALKALQLADQSQGQADSSLSWVNNSLSGIASSLNWASSSASEVANDGEGKDVSSAGSSAASSLSSVQGSFSSAQGYASSSRSSQSTVTGYGYQVVSYLDQAIAAAGREASPSETPAADGFAYADPGLYPTPAYVAPMDTQPAYFANPIAPPVRNLPPPPVAPSPSGLDWEAYMAPSASAPEPTVEGFFRSLRPR